MSRAGGDQFGRAVAVSADGATVAVGVPYQSGWQGAFIAKQGYYSSVPETVKANLAPEEWDYWYEGKPAKIDIKDPYGQLMEKAGNTRDGGSFWERMGREM